MKRLLIVLPDKPQSPGRRELLRQQRRWPRDRRLATGLAAAGSTMMFLILAFVATPLFASELQDMKQQLGTLQKKIESLEEDRKETKGKGLPRFFVVPGTKTAIKFGGFVQFDTQFDFRGDSGDTFSAGSIPLNKLPDTQKSREHLRMTARNARLNFTSVTPSPWGNVTGFLEFDFRGGAGNQSTTNAEAPRLRHAYVEAGPWLVGQVWSNFWPTPGTAANSISWVSSSGSTFSRQQQIRYSTALGATELKFSAENPEVNIGNAPAGGRDINDVFPDIVVKAIRRGKWGLMDVAFLNRVLQIDRAGVKEREYGGGVMANVRINTWGKDALFIGAVGGRGLGRYLDFGFPAANLTNGQIEPSRQWGAKLGYRHVFNEQFESNLFGGIEKNDPEPGFAGDPNRRLMSGHLNVYYRPYPKEIPLWCGLEYVHGERLTQKGDAGREDRLHFAVNYSF